MVSYILLTGYSILLFMNPLNFVAVILKVLLVIICLPLWTLSTFFKNKKRLKNKKNVKGERKKRDQNKKNIKRVLHLRFDERSSTCRWRGLVRRSVRPRPPRTPIFAIPPAPAAAKARIVSLTEHRWGSDRPDGRAMDPSRNAGRYIDDSIMRAGNFHAWLTANIQST